MSELCHLWQSEGYGACDDDTPQKNSGAGTSTVCGQQKINESGQIYHAVISKGTCSYDVVSAIFFSFGMIQNFMTG